MSLCRQKLYIVCCIHYHVLYIYKMCDECCIFESVKSYLVMEIIFQGRNDNTKFWILIYEWQNEVCVWSKMCVSECYANIQMLCFHYID